MNSLYVRRAALCAAGITCLAAGSASAGVVWSAVSGSKSASADFSVSGGQLTIVLSNDSMADAGVPTDILTGVYFDIPGSPLSLGKVSVTVASGSAALVGGTGAAAPTDAGSVVGGEYGYKGGLVGAPHGAKYGISSSGLGLFGGGDLFPGSNLEGPGSPDGIQYGITTKGDNLLTGNGGITGTGLIKYAVVIVLNNAGNLNPSSITNVSFQYGTDLSEPNLQGSPTPGAIALIGISGLVASRRRR